MDKTIGAFDEKLLDTLSSIDCSNAVSNFATHCTNADLAKISASKVAEIAGEKSNMPIIIGIAVVLIICCCIYCCCSSSGAFYWFQKANATEEQKK